MRKKIFLYYKSFYMYINWNSLGIFLNGSMFLLHRIFLNKRFYYQKRLFIFILCLLVGLLNISCFCCCSILQKKFTVFFSILFYFILITLLHFHLNWNVKLTFVYFILLLIFFLLLLAASDLDLYTTKFKVILNHD